MPNIEFVGRERELMQLNGMLHRESARLVVIKGRRRVGKSRLMAEFGKDKTYYRFVGLAPDENIRRWQDRITPIWKRLGGGCHLNRPIPSLIEQGGFKIKNIETMYIPGWKPASFNYWGSAVQR